MNITQADKYWELGTTWGKRMMQIASLLGTVYVAIYFIRIRSVPFDNWAGIGGMAVLIAVLSTVFFVAMAVMWGFPTFAFRLAMDIDREHVAHWFYGGTRLSQVRRASLGRVVLWAFSAIALPWLELFAAFIPESFGGSFAALCVQLACLVTSGTVFIFYVLDRPVYVGRQTPRIIRRGTLLRVIAGLLTVACAMCPLLLFCDLLQLSQYEHVNGDLLIFGLIVAATLFAMVSNMATMTHELNAAGSGWQHEAARLMLSGFFLICFIGALGCSGRLQDRIMEISTVRVPHATVVLKEAGCQPLRMVGLLGTPPADAAASSPALAGSNVGKRASPPGADAPSAADGCVIRDVFLLAHAGSTWPVACVDPDGVISGTRLSVHAEDVAEVLTGDQTRLKPAPAAVIALCTPVGVAAAASSPAKSPSAPAKAMSAP